ncbi:MAG: ABC transporter ATP-binding protein/permease [Pegethrix bostrychoides GSE-TBD4-15B]|jgi:ABC-type multidrug transport system fused ATPase/permease subunit|uniref:ABC transporter ATP-binding protein/permease n=1 Tax=Pegethrix bostrychoides GSE-TBD4-15B TaxID=2839662 RepID=A0A951PDU9_9CYAN|nr:ABC transporter ATP-binding protein/permease [Pegethrix bostrychoides GSE-TBD4-15B]
MSVHPLLFNLFRRYPRLIALNILLGFSGALFNGVSTALIIPVLLSFLGQSVATKGAPPIIQSLLTPFQGQAGDYSLLLMTGAILLTLIFKNLATYCSSLTSSKLKRVVANDLREQGLQMLLEVDIDYFVKTGIGDISNRLNNELTRTASIISIYARIATVIATLLVFVFILISLSWQLTIIATLLMLAVALVSRGSIIRSKKFGREFSEASKRYSSGILDILYGMRLVRSSATETQELQNAKRQIFNREQAEFRLQAVTALIEPISEVTGILALLCIVYIGKTFLVNQVETFSAVLLTYLFILFRTLPLVAQLNSARSQLSSLVPSLEISSDFLRRDNKSFMSNGSEAFTALHTGIHFNQISFAYPGQEKQVLREVNLYLPRNQTLALVGTSGAGKSTLADLLPRFYDPCQGNISIDGRDLRDWDIQSLRRAMGIVSQDTFLFNLSVRENIAYGCPTATDDQVINAAKRANAYEFIVQLPSGFETKIGDRGLLLSGGQRQRIAIARALVQNPEILILDEATSALDTVSERLVQEAIEHLSHNRTTLVIAHRLSTVQKADQIAVMDQGRVVELGTHEQLLAKNGYYRQLCEMQFSSMSDIRAVPGLNQELLAQQSYELRSHLNSLVGALGLVVEGVVESPEEQQEWIRAAYRAAIDIVENTNSQYKSGCQPNHPSSHLPDQSAQSKSCIVNSEAHQADKLDRVGLR